MSFIIHQMVQAVLRGFGEFLIWMFLNMLRTVLLLTALIPYIRLFTRHDLSANSSLKSCIKSTRVNFSRNPSESFKIYFICNIVSNLREWIFHDFDTFANIAENGCTRKKPDIRYILLRPQLTKKWAKPYTLTYTSEGIWTPHTSITEITVRQREFSMLTWIYTKLHMVFICPNVLWKWVCPSITTNVQ